MSLEEMTTRTAVERRALEEIAVMDSDAKHLSNDLGHPGHAAAPMLRFRDTPGGPAHREWAMTRPSNRGYGAGGCGTESADCPLSEGPADLLLTGGCLEEPATGDLSLSPSSPGDHEACAEDSSVSVSLG